MGLRAGFYLLVSFFLCITAFAQSPVLNLSPRAKFSISELNNLPEHILEEIKQGNYTESLTNSPSFSASIDKEIWFYFTFSGNEILEGNYFLEVDFARIDTLTIYSIWNNTSKLIHTSGDGLNFEDRSVWLRSNVMQVSVNRDSVYSFLVRSVKTGDITLPIYLWDENTYLKKTEKESLSYGLGFGVLLGLIFFNLALFLFNRKKVYFYYLVYTILTLLFLLTNYGFSQVILWENLPFLNNQGLFTFGQFGIVFLLLFVTKFLDFKSTFPKIEKLAFWFIIIPLCFLFLGYLSIDYVDFLKENYSVLLIVNFLLYVFTFLLTIISAILLVIKGNNNAKLLLVSITFATMGYSLNAFRVIGVLPNNFITSNGLLFGSVSEVLLLSLGIAYRLKIAYDERNKLLIERNTHQTKLVKALIQGQEEERNRIGRELHDGIGTSLAGVKLSFSKVLEEEGQNSIDKVIEEVRSISHALISPDVAKYGLIKQTKELLENLNTHSQIKFSFIHHDWPNLDQEVELTLYRIIQEAVNNIHKHSGALEATIQLLGDSDSLFLSIEDNGIGLSETIRYGKGIQNMKDRILSLGGTFSMDSSEVYGTILQFEMRI